MIKQYINVGNYTYYTELIRYEENPIYHYSGQFVMLRNFDIMNNLVFDNNIYFIEKTFYDKYKTDLNKNDIISLLFPTNKNGLYYSFSYEIFNNTLTDDDLRIENIVNGSLVYSNGLSVYNIYDKIVDEDDKITFKEKTIKCDTIKIYHPHIKSKNNFIVHVENHINGIHFHYICNLYDNFSNNSNSEIRYKNNIYSEYIEIHIPKITELFDRTIISIDNNDIKYDYTTYYEENLSIIDDSFADNHTFLSNTIIYVNSNNEVVDINEKDIISNSKLKQYVPVALFTQPWAIEEYDKDKNIFKKKYFKYKFILENNYLITPINLTLYPFDYIDKTNKIYLQDTSLSPGTCCFGDDYKFSLAATCCFGSNDIISLDVAINYPEKEYFESVYKDSALEKAYCFYHHIHKDIYKNTNLLQEYKEELDEINCLNSIDDETIQYLIDMGYARNNLSKNEYIEILKQKRLESFLSEYIEENKVNIDFFGFRIEMASDNTFKHIIFSKNVSIMDPIRTFNENTLNPFANLKNGLFTYPINTIFTAWEQLPENIVCRVSFIDKFIGVTLTSNNVIISKEKFKYMTNNTGLYRLSDLTKINKEKFSNDNMKEISLKINDEQKEQQLDDILSDVNVDNKENLKRNILDWFTSNNNDNINFINNISCFIKSNKENELSEKNNSIISNSNIIYKPIFFKVDTLQNVKIKENQVQNIAIDLGEYISKVDLFIMTIENEILQEIGRKSNYVIFNINAIKLKETSGTYNIFNQDEEYITYGNWTIV